MLYIGLDGQGLVLFLNACLNYGLYLAHHIRQMYPCALYPDIAVFDTAHVEHVIDQAQQMPARYIYLFQIVKHLPAHVDMAYRQRCKADDRIHRSAYIVRHIVQEVGLGSACLPRLRQRILECRLLRQLVLSLRRHVAVGDEHRLYLAVLTISVRYDKRQYPSASHRAKCIRYRLSAGEPVCDSIHVYMRQKSLLIRRIDVVPYIFPLRVPVICRIGMLDIVLTESLYQLRLMRAQIHQRDG